MPTSKTCAMTRGYVYDDSSGYVTLALRVLQEEGGEEYASYHGSQAEREASFGPGVAVAVVDNGEGHAEDAVVRRPLERAEEGGSEDVSPSERCGTGAGYEHGVALGSLAHREDIRQECRKRAPGWYRNRVRSPGARSTRGRGDVVLHGGAIAGCLVGGVAGGTFATVTTVGLGTAAGAYGGCFIVGGAVIILEDIF